jgi:antitoxin component YwqK of YwqJK toxin-antitoxin module
LAQALNAQQTGQPETKNDTIFNQLDKQGKKTGWWKGTYPDGTIRYYGYFEDGKPVGLMKRYMDDGTLQAKIYFYNDDRAFAKLYYNDGNLAAEGIYVNMKKDSLWKYYSYYSQELMAKEWYNSGLKDSISVKYYESGQVFEKLYWKNGKKDGQWIQYFENGEQKLKGHYDNGTRTGDFKTYYPSGNLETDGKYKDNLMTGNWDFYLPDGSEEMSIEFEAGKAKNPDKLLKKQRDFLELIEENKGKIPEPADAMYEHGTPPAR